MRHFYITLYSICKTPLSILLYFCASLEPLYLKLDETSAANIISK